MELYSDYTDSQLFEKLREGQKDAFKEIYNRYFTPLYHYAYSVTDSTEDSNDIIQEIFASLWIRRESLEIIHIPKAYLYQCLRNKCARYIENNIRKRNFLEGLSAAMENTKTTSTTNQFDAKETESRINETVAAMPLKMKTVYLLSRHEKLSHREIGEQLEITENTVKKHVQNALKIIKRNLHSLFF